MRWHSITHPEKAAFFEYDTVFNRDMWWHTVWYQLTDVLK